MDPILSRKPSLLLSLPPEIKFSICRFVAQQDSVRKDRRTAPDMVCAARQMGMESYWHTRGKHALFISCKELSGVVAGFVFDTLRSSKVGGTCFQHSIWLKYRHLFKTLALDSDDEELNSVALSLAHTLPGIDRLHLDGKACSSVNPITYDGTSRHTLVDLLAMAKSFVVFASNVKRLTMVDPSYAAFHELLPPFTALQSLTLHHFEDVFGDDPDGFYDTLEDLTHLAHLRLLPTNDSSLYSRDPRNDLRVPEKPSSFDSLEALEIRELSLDPEGNTWANLLRFTSLTTVDLHFHEGQSDNFSSFTPSFDDPHRHDFPFLQFATLSGVSIAVISFLRAFRRAPLLTLDCCLHGLGTAPQATTSTISSTIFDGFSQDLRSLSFASAHQESDLLISPLVAEGKRTWPLIAARTRLSTGGKLGETGLSGEHALVSEMASYVQGLADQLLEQGDEAGLQALSRALAYVPPYRMMLNE